MNAKLTLNIEEEITRKAKLFARSRGKSLSKVVEQYLRFVTEGEQPSSRISERVAGIADDLEIPEGLGSDDLKTQYLLEKYLRTQDSG